MSQPKLRVLDLFSGIGGFSRGLEMTGGFETVAFCEIDEFCRKVLDKHWPAVPCFDDVTTLKGTDVGAVDVICGGFPCQDISVAGLGAGLDGARSGLWSEFSRLIGELRPGIVLVENVSNLLLGPSERPGAWFSRILGDLAALGYDAEWHCIPASSVGAAHGRDRVWIIAYPNQDHDVQREHVHGIGGEAAYSEQEGREADGVPASHSSRPSYPEQGVFSLGRSLGRMGRLLESLQRHRDWQTTSEPVLDRGTDGIPHRVDRCGALGNAVIPQIPELIGRAILSTFQPANGG